MRGSVYLAGLTIVASTTVARAAPPTAAAPMVQRGTQVRASKPVVQRFDRIRSARRPPARPGYRLARGATPELVAKGLLHTYVDGIALLAVPVTAQQEAILRRVGAKEVRAAKLVRHHTLFEGRYHWELKVAPAAGRTCAGCAADRLTGPDPARLARKVGQLVVLVLQRDRDGQTWVVDLQE